MAEGGSQCAPDTYVSVRYRKRCYWISQGDEHSKRMFLIVQILMSLTDTATCVQAPLLTIPAG
jgi:hypothetical protein